VLLLATVAPRPQKHAKSESKPVPENSRLQMASSSKCLTYRFSSLPHALQHQELLRLFDDDDREKVVAMSIAPCLLRPLNATIATVTFRGQPSFISQLVNGEATIPFRSADAVVNVKVDDNFHGLTPLNAVAGVAKAE
jgi:hypothetical protein